MVKEEEEEEEGEDEEGGENCGGKGEWKVGSDQGFDAGLPRMPLGDLLPEEKKKVDALLADMGDIL